MQTVHVYTGGTLRDRSILALSGGKKRRVAIALVLAYSELVASKGQVSCNVAVYDEVQFFCFCCQL